MLNHEVNARGFVFQGIRRWPGINLVTLNQEHFYLISLETVVGYWKLRSFQEILVNLNGLLEKLDVKYPSQDS